MGALDGNKAVLGEWVDQLVAVTSEQGFPHWGASGTIYRGWFEVKNRDVSQAIIRQPRRLAAIANSRPKGLPLDVHNGPTSYDSAHLSLPPARNLKRLLLCPSPFPCPE